MKEEPYLELRKTGRMICVRCGGFSSSRTCWNCCQRIAIPCQSCADLRAEVARLMEVKFHSGSFGPYIFGMDIADGMETTVVSRVGEDGTIKVKK